MNKIIQGDSLIELRRLPDKSINMCMTSPPYWALRDYGRGTESIWGIDKHCDHDFEIKEKKHPMDRKGATGNLGNKKSLDDAQGNVKSGFCNKCGSWKGQLGLEPTFDLYIKHLCDVFDEVKRVLRDDGTCWVNLGDTYGGLKGGGPDRLEREKENKGWGDKSKKFVTRPPKANVPDKSLCMIPMRFAIEMVNRGWILRNTIIWYKPNCMPSSVKDRFTVDFEYLFFFSKKKRYYFEQQLEPIVDPESYRGMRPRKAHTMSKHDMKHYAFAGSVNKDGNLKQTGKKYPNRNKRTTWKINPKGFKESHFAVYPEKLCETPIKAGCPEGGTVLDIFFGAGTTGLVALKQNKKFIGIELNKEYIEIAERRLKPYLEQTTLKI